jgi:hypothetical protein
MQIARSLPEPIRKVLLSIGQALARIVASIGIITAIVANLGSIRRASAIALFPDGGFGHTIMAPDWLRRLHPGDATLTFFATSYDRDRHNLLVPQLWVSDRLVWVRQGFVLPKLGTIYDSPWSFRLFRVLKRFLAWYVPKTPCYLGVDDLVAATPRPSWLAAGSAFNSRYENRYYPLIQEKSAPALHVGEATRNRVARSLLNRCGSDFSRRCAFYVRYRGFAYGEDTSSLNRIAPELDAHLPAIRVLVRAGYQVLLTGDVDAPEDMIADFAGGVADWRAAGVDRDEFRLFAGTEVDIHIGSQSGGSAYVYVTDMPALMLNGFPPGDALPQTTVSYKWLHDPDGGLVGLSDMLGGMFFDHQLHGCHLVDNSPDEMAETVADFIANCGKRPFGIDHAELGIEAPWIRAANARLSPAWLKNYCNRAKAHT